MPQDWNLLSQLVNSIIAIVPAPRVLPVLLAGTYRYNFVETTAVDPKKRGSASTKTPVTVEVQHAFFSEALHYLTRSFSYFNPCPCNIEC